METSLVSRDELLEKLQENRTTHKANYDKAHKAWKKKATKALTKAAKKAEEEGVITLLPLQDLPKPQHYLNSYDSVIARLKMEVEDKVEITAPEFDAWVLDNWTWRGQFVAGTSLYNNAI